MRRNKRVDIHQDPGSSQLAVPAVQPTRVEQLGTDEPARFIVGDVRDDRVPSRSRWRSEGP